MGDYPTVASDELDAGPWELGAESEDRVFRTPAATVTGHTRVYVDGALRTALAAAGSEARLAAALDAGDGDRMVDLGGDVGDDGAGFCRFFFATGLSFSPPLAPGVGPASALPTVVTEARRSFAADLEARGFRDVERGRSQRVRTDTGDRARLVKYTASLPLDGGGLEVEGWLAVWATGGSFRVAGGAYPVAGLDALLADLPEDERPETAPGAFRDDLLALIRAVR